MEAEENLSQYTVVELHSILRELTRIRLVEQAFSTRYVDQKMRCPVHLSVGQEAIPVGISMFLSDTDHVYSNHRSHGHYLAKGGSLKRMVAEIYGKSTGCCGGRGGSMHLVDLDVGFMGSTPIVGGTVPIAVGDAWAASLNNIDRVTVVYFGDGCFEEGVIHESMNFSALHNLPILFVCENNSYSVYTNLSDRQPANRSIAGVAEAHGLTVFQGDGNNVLECLAFAQKAIKNARNARGPQFLELKTHRWLEHCGPNDDDALGYRQDGELAYWESNCPIKRFIYKLESNGLISKDVVSLVEEGIRKEIEQAFLYAVTSSAPEQSEIGVHLYA